MSHRQVALGGQPRRRNQRGVALIELALAFPMLAVICLGVVDFARVYSLQVKLRNAARVGADYAQLYPLSRQPYNGACSDPSNIRYQVYAEAGTTDVTVVVTPSEPNGCPGAPGSPPIAVGCPVKVDVSQRFTPVTPLLSKIIGTPTVHGTVTVNTQTGWGNATCPST